MHLRAAWKWLSWEKNVIEFLSCHKKKQKKGFCVSAKVVSALSCPTESSFGFPVELSANLQFKTFAVICIVILWETRVLPFPELEIINKTLLSRSNGK